MINFDVDVREITESLKRLSAPQAKKVYRRSIRAAAKMVADNVKQSVMSSFKGAVSSLKTRKIRMTGNMRKILKRAIMVRRPRKAKRGNIQFGIMFNTKKYPQLIHTSKAGKRSFIPAAIEYGHGNAKPVPFVRTAYERSKNMVLDAMKKSIWRDIEKIATK